MKKSTLAVATLFITLCSFSFISAAYAEQKPSSCSSCKAKACQCDKCKSAESKGSSCSSCKGK